MVEHHHINSDQLGIVGVWGLNSYHFMHNS